MVYKYNISKMNTHDSLKNVYETLMENYG